MSWKPIDFQGIMSLNPQMVDQLYSYLEDKEAAASEALLQAIHTVSNKPILPVGSTTKLKVNEAAEVMEKAVRRMQATDKGNFRQEWAHSVEEINQILWDYFEVVEECVTELFQQLDYVQIDEWRDELFQVVEQLKEILNRHLDDLRWAIRRLNQTLKEYLHLYTKKWSVFNFLDMIVRPPIDRALNRNVEKCSKILGFNFQKFSDRFTRFRQTSVKLEQAQNKFNWYPVFNGLEITTQNALKKLYRLTKLWELNRSAKAFPEDDVVRVIRNLFSPHKVLEMFEEYKNQLTKTLYEKSRSIKGNDKVFTEEGILHSDEEILCYRSEVHTIGGLIKKYRNFLLKTDPNPYVRVRLGFPDWVVGQEPAYTKKMREINLSLGALDDQFENLRQAIERKAVVEDPKIQDVDGGVRANLHEMGQPLISNSLMHHYAGRFVSQLQQLDELSSSRPEVVEFIGQCLNKALRFDWKYHTLFDVSDFKSLYETHLGIVGPSDERAHQNRYFKFEQILSDLKRWLKNKETHRHMHEIEMDMSDMKGYLQDFLGYAQRLSRDEDLGYDKSHRALVEMSNQLLEYRYLFGNFFHNLHDKDPEERMIRNQFLFVDQYLEAVDNRLHEWKESISKQK